MRLLMRANAHRPVPEGDGPGGVEVASSPDTPGRPERWLWHMRLLDGAPAPSEGKVTLAMGQGRTLEVTVNTGAVRADVQLLDVTESELLDRDEKELVALIASESVAVVEGRHVLHPSDTLVLEGDDPLRVSVRPANGHASVAVVRLTSATDGPHGMSVNWVP
ncbi:MAG TPA: hypothetical protein VFX33_06185 [Actinomycetales bacterium]|nr:hypothetical protein [Actinomycetales bacterium]